MTGLADGPGRLLLVRTRVAPERILATLTEAGEVQPWLFLAQDYLRLLHWVDVLGREALVPLAESLASAAEDLRDPFLHLIARLGRRHDSLAWWASRISERNTAVSPLFLHCCYLAVAADRLRQSREPLVVVSESPAVLHALAEIATASGRPVEWVGASPAAKRSRLASGGARLTRTVGRLRRFLAQAALRRALSPRARPVPAAGSNVLLRTWVDDACFDEHGEFRDRYLPGLREWLEARGARVLTIPMLFNVSDSYRGVQRGLAAASADFLSPESYYHASDYLFALRVAARGAQLPGGALGLRGLDVTRLFDAERERAAFDHGTLEAILSSRLPKRLAAAGVHIDLFVDGYENMIPEKPLILGFRQFMRDTRLVGFQHGALYPLLLCNFVTPEEADFAPLPDRVVCNGPFFRDVLVGEGLPAERAVIGPALRYRHLRSGERHREGGAGEDQLVLVPLPFVREMAVELLHKVLAALGPLEGVRVALKPHPMARTGRLLEAARIDALPAGFEFVEGDMGRWLAAAHVAVAAGSSAVHETLAAGVPVVIVGRETALDLNPLGWEPELGRVFRDPEDICVEVTRLASLSREELAAYREESRRVLEESFAPVTDERMAAFIDGLVELPGG